VSYIVILYQLNLIMNLIKIMLNNYNIWQYNNNILIYILNFVFLSFHFPFFFNIIKLKKILLRKNINIWYIYLIYY